MATSFHGVARCPRDGLKEGSRNHFKTTMGFCPFRGPAAFAIASGKYSRRPGGEQHLHCRNATLSSWRSEWARMMALTATAANGMSGHDRQRLLRPFRRCSATTDNAAMPHPAIAAELGSGTGVKLMLSTTSARTIICVPALLR
jgi:hypothetical protein